MEAISERNLTFGRILLVVTLLCLLVGPNFGPVPNYLGGQLELEPATIWLIVCFLIAFSVITAAVLWLEGKGFRAIGPALRSLGLGQPSRLAPIIVGTVVGLAWTALGVMNVLQFNPEANILEISPFRILAAVIGAVGAMLEDLITRGFLMNQLNRINVPNWIQVVFSALVFAFYHTVWSFNALSFAFSMVYGLILSGLYLWGRRSLTPVILAHSLSVFLAEPFMTMILFLIPA